MNSINKFPVFSILICIILFQSCGDGSCGDLKCLNGGECVEGLCYCPDGYVGEDCGIFCFDEIKGTWNVTDQSTHCDYVSYTFGVGTSERIFSLDLNDGTRVLSGHGLMDDECKTMTYSVSTSGIIISGAITFNGSTLEDRLDGGCFVSASRQ